MADIVVDGKTRVYWVTTISNIAAPTVAELNAGINITSICTRDGLIGFGPDTADVDSTGLDATFEAKRAGTAQFGDVRLRLKKQSSGDTTYTTLTYQTEGYVVIRRNVAQGTAWAASQNAEVFPAQCGYRMYMDPELNTLSRYEIPIKITDDPNLDAVVAA
jgi:hypothetical protein